MRELECTVVLDIQMSETAALADYVLPCTTALEREDFPIFHSNLCTEPYVQWTEPVIAPQGEARSEWDIFVALGDAMGLRFLDDRWADLTRSLLRLVGGDFSRRWLADAMIRTGPRGDGYLPWRSGWSIARLAAEPHGVRLGALRTGILREKLLTPDGKIPLRRAEIEREMQRLRAAAGEATVALDYPFRLIGRRDNRSNNSWLRNVPKLMRGDRCRRLRIHPDDAARVGVVDGGRARVRSRVGAVDVEVRVTDEVMPGVVSLPHGWSEDATNRRVADRAPGPNCNALIDQRAIEPLAGMALLNGFPVAVEAVAG
jgi:formate dehydrogenase